MSYSANSDIDQVFGATNVTAWADLDNDADATKISNRKTQARNIAYEWINEVLRCTPYTIPVANKAGTVPPTIVNLEATLAGLWMYEARGSQDYNPNTGLPYHRLAWRRREAHRQLQEIRAGLRKLDAL